MDGGEKKVWGVPWHDTMGNRGAQSRLYSTRLCIGWSIAPQFLCSMGDKKGSVEGVCVVDKFLKVFQRNPGVRKVMEEGKQLIT